MNDILIFQELAAVLSGDGYAALAALFTPAPTDAVPEPTPQIYAAQTATPIGRPSLTISGSFDPYAHRRMGQVVFEVRSRVGDETEGQHQACFEALYTALLGPLGADAAAVAANAATARATLMGLVAARGKVAIISYGPAQNTISGDVDGDDLRTTLMLRFAWLFLTPP